MGASSQSATREIPRPSFLDIGCGHTACAAEGRFALSCEDSADPAFSGVHRERIAIMTAFPQVTDLVTLARENWQCVRI